MKINLLTILMSVLFIFKVGSTQSYKDMRIFSNVINHIRSNYIDEKETSELIFYAINGVLRSLDPHCIYLNPNQFCKFSMITQGKMYGIGIEFSMTSGSPVVINVVDNSPAEKSGILPGDVLKRVNGINIYNNITLPELELKIYGEKDSKILMTFFRYLTDSEYEVKIKREEIDQPTIPYFLILGANSIYMKCSNFSSNTSEEIFDYLHKINTKLNKKLIIDLRNNPGGQLHNTIEIAKYFLAKGDTILKTIGRKNNINKIYINEKEGFFKLPVIILVNRSSASASELLAGSLQDNDRGLIIGTNTFGKGLIQSSFLLDNGGAILMTIGRYATPSGRTIQREFKNKSFKEYYDEIYNTNSTNFKERPIFKSKNKRNIYGGGGIIPDIFVENESLIPSNVEKKDLKFYGLNFATRYLRENKNFDKYYKTFYEFNNLFELSEEIFEKINKSLSGIDNIVGFIEFNHDFINLIKANIAEIIWGKEAAFLVSTKYDEQLKTAISFNSDKIKDYLLSKSIHN